MKPSPMHVVQAPTPAHASSPQLRTAAPGKPASVDMHEQARIVQLQQQEQQEQQEQQA